MWTAQDREIYQEVGKRYPSDLSDAEWTLAARFFVAYRPLSATIREIVQACLYLVAEGCRWRALPGDFPPLADRPLVVGPLPARGRLGRRRPHADARRTCRRRPRRRAPDRPGRRAERALR